MTDKRSNTAVPQSCHPDSGAIPSPKNGTAFRVWAPNADGVAVVGTFNAWDETVNPLRAETSGYWSATVPQAGPGDEYRFIIQHRDKALSRIDPYAREVTHSAGNGVICDCTFDFSDDTFQPPPLHQLIIYEMHVGTFNPRKKRNQKEFKPGGFKDAVRKLGYLQRLGINAVELMPVMEFPTDISWGYNPALLFAIESAYGGPHGLHTFVKEAHKRGIAVILDVVYNHFGPGDLSLWQFDGWSTGGQGGIYFFNDERAHTPWGDTRPDYSRAEVRQFIRNNVFYWFENFNVDGLRWDATNWIRNLDGGNDPGRGLPEGWNLMQEINHEVGARYPSKFILAEDMQENGQLTLPVQAGGAGFTAQWSADFVHTVRSGIITPNDAGRDMDTLAAVLSGGFNSDSLQRIIYTESHDEVADGKARVPFEIDPADADGWFARKRSTLGACLVFTAPGIPMIFQGQEFLQDEWFRDNDPLDWKFTRTHKGITRLYHDLIHLRKNCAGTTPGLTGSTIIIHHINNHDKVLAFLRGEHEAADDFVAVAANFANQSWDDYVIGLPCPGPWKVRFNSDNTHYGNDFEGESGLGQVTAVPGEYDGLPCHASLSLGPYSVILLSQDMRPDMEEA